MGTYKTPGVYIVEKDAFPNSVVEVATAVPAFVGYTEKAQKGKKHIPNQPVRISSMAEYEKFFGGAHQSLFVLEKAVAPATGGNGGSGGGSRGSQSNNSNSSANDAAPAGANAIPNDPNHIEINNDKYLLKLSKYSPK